MDCLPKGLLKGFFQAPVAYFLSSQAHGGGFFQGNPGLPAQALPEYDIDCTTLKERSPLYLGVIFRLPGIHRGKFLPGVDQFIRGTVHVILAATAPKGQPD